MDGPAPILEALRGADHVLLTGPIAPDGDSIGACLALQRILEHHSVRCDVAGTPNYRYDWLPDAGRMVPDSALGAAYDAVVVLDGDRHRLTPPAQRAFEGARIKGIIDHHGSTNPDGYTHWWLDGMAPSTCQMLYRHRNLWGMPLDSILAAHLYTGAVFDTGGFRYSNTTPATHAMAADLIAYDIGHASICTRILMERRLSGLRLAGHVFSHTQLHANGQLAVGVASADLKHRFDNVDGDLEGIVDNLVHLLGVEVAVLLVQRDGDEVKYSLRSRGKIDVSQVARELSPKGGGHPKAAGASVFCSVEEAGQRAVAAISRALHEAGRSAG